jgi:hypothetical protein
MSTAYTRVFKSKLGSTFFVKPTGPRGTLNALLLPQSQWEKHKPLAMSKTPALLRGGKKSSQEIATTEERFGQDHALSYTGKAGLPHWTMG